MLVSKASVHTRCAWTVQRSSRLCVSSVCRKSPGLTTPRQPPPHVGWAAARPPLEAQRRRALSGVVFDEDDADDELCTFFSRCVARVLGFGLDMPSSSQGSTRLAGASTRLAGLLHPWDTTTCRKAACGSSTTYLLGWERIIISAGVAEGAACVCTQIHGTVVA